MTPRTRPGKISAMAYRCHTCGQEHDTLPDLGADKPDHWFGIPPGERAARVKLTSDTCVIDGQDHFVRGLLLLPLTDADLPGDAFGIGVWVSLSARNFQTYLDHYDSADIGPFFGWLCTRIRGYDPPTTTLKSRVRFRGGTMRPMVEMEPTDHPLAVDQRNGIPTKRAWEIIHQYG
jgi:hypothetical protein